MQLKLPGQQNLYATAKIKSFSIDAILQILENKLNMNLVKNILAVASVCLTLLSCAFAESVSESENSFSVSGKNYRIEFDKSCGAIRKIFSNDRELSLKNSSDALWSAEFTDHTKVDSSKTQCAARIDGDKLVLDYTSPDIDVSVSIVPHEEYADFDAVVTPKKKDVLTFSIPAEMSFSPKQLGGLSFHNSIPRNSGLLLNGNFFKDRLTIKDASGHIWSRGQCTGGSPYETLLQAPMHSVGKFKDFFPLTEGKDAKEWLGEGLAKKLVSKPAQATRTFSKGSADIVLADSPNGVFFGGSRRGGKGAFFRIGGWLGNGKDHNPLGYVTALVKHAKKISQDTQRNKVLLLNFPTSQMSSRMKIDDWMRILKTTGCKVDVVKTIKELQDALQDKTVLAIVNPYEELCPTPLEMPLSSFVLAIKNFVVDGGYWFETGGYTFYYEMTPMRFLRARGDVPASVGDYFHFKLAGQNMALYAVQPIEWEAWSAEKDKSKMFIPSSFQLYGSDEGGKIFREFKSYIKSGEKFKSPTVRMRFGKDRLESAEAFCADNGVKKTFDEKMPKELAEKFKSCVLYKTGAPNVAGMREISDQLPSPCIVHTSSYLKGGFDKEYPDHVPPRESFGTPEEFKAYIAHIKSRGDFFMPYTNNTWWCDNPKGPTFEKNGTDPLSLDINGKPYHEMYGNNDGWTITMWHPAVREANDKLLKEFLEDYPSDFIFQDQSGARNSRYDFNKASPTPNAYIEGMISTVRQDSKKAYLSTEDGWYGICDWEIQFCGMSFGFMRKIEWGNLIWDDIPKDAFNLDNLSGAMFHDKVSLTHHNLGSSVETPRDAAITLGYGFSMINFAYEHFFNNVKGYRDWIKWVDRIQKSVAAKYIGKKMHSFKHSWRDEKSADGDGVIRAKYGDVSIVANMGKGGLKNKRVVLGEDSFYATAPGMIAAGNLKKIGSKKVGNSSFIVEKIGDKTFLWLYGEPDKDAYFQLLDDGVTSLKTKDGISVDVEVDGGVGKIRMPISKDGGNVFMEFECVSQQ